MENVGDGMQDKRRTKAGLPTSRWLHPTKTYRPGTRQGKACLAMTRNIFGQEYTYATAEWETVATIAYNLQALGHMDVWMSMPRDKVKFQELFAELHFDTAIQFINYLRDNNIIEEIKGQFSSIPEFSFVSQYLVQNWVAWDMMLKAMGSQIPVDTEKGVAWKRKVDGKRRSAAGIDKDISRVIRNINTNMPKVDIHLHIPISEYRALSSDKQETLLSFIAFNTDMQVVVSKGSSKGREGDRGTLSTTNISPLLPLLSSQNSEKIWGGLGVVNCAISHRSNHQHQTRILRPQGTSARGKQVWVDMGGRIYCDIQTIPSICRPWLRFDDVVPTGVDLKGSHLYMAYSSLGHPLASDPYLLPSSGDRMQYGADKAERDKVKAALLRMLNASSRSAAISSFCEYLLKERTTLGSPWVNCDEFFKAIEDKHSSIKHLFYTDKGVEYMGYEGELMIALMTWANTKGIFVVPIHDQVLCKPNHYDAVHSFIENWCITKFGTLPLLERKL